MRDRIRDVMAIVFARPSAEIPEDASPETLEGWDSLRHLELMLEIEMTFGVRIPADQVPEMVSVSAIEDALQANGAG